MEVDVMTDKELVVNTIARYMDLLRIEKAEDDWKRELKNQLRETRAMLETLGVVVEKLVIN